MNSTLGYIPFIGTSIGRDPQQLVLRLFYSTRDYPVKHFIVVVPEKALSPPHAAIWYELEHLKEYADNVVIIACKRTPSVAEGWNAGEPMHKMYRPQLLQHPAHSILEIVCYSWTAVLGGFLCMSCKAAYSYGSSISGGGGCGTGQVAAAAAATAQQCT
jgi:hypothetical protein